MKYLVKMSDREYRAFRRYTARVKNISCSECDTDGSLTYKEAERWLLSMGKIRLIDRKPNTRGTIYKDAYLVIQGNEYYLNNVLEILYTKAVYNTEEAPTYGWDGKWPDRKIMYTVLKRTENRRIIREV